MQPTRGRRPRSRAGLVGALVGGLWASAILGLPFAWWLGDVPGKGDEGIVVVILGYRKNLGWMLHGLLCGGIQFGLGGAVVGYLLGERLGNRDRDGEND